jgi:hypothetical protein
MGSEDHCAWSVRTAGVNKLGWCAIHAKHVFGIQSGLFRTGKELTRGDPLGSPCTLLHQEEGGFSFTQFFRSGAAKTDTALTRLQKGANVGRLPHDEPAIRSPFCAAFRVNPNIPSVYFRCLAIASKERPPAEEQAEPAAATACPSFESHPFSSSSREQCQQLAERTVDHRQTHELGVGPRVLSFSIWSRVRACLMKDGRSQRG